MVAASLISQMADASSAATAMRDYIRPSIDVMCALASLFCVFFLITGGISYITSSGKPDNLEHAKKVIRNALLGLVLVIGAAVLTQILVGVYSGSSQAVNAKLPSLTTVQPNSVSNGLVAILIKAVTGLLNNIVQTIASPILNALSFFTSGTPLMAANSAVFNLWEVMVGLSDSLMVLIIALLGFHVMSASTFGFDEIEFKHLLPRIGLIFLLANVSIFAIDGVISLSNAMIHAVNISDGSLSVWTVLTDVVKQAGSQSVAALLIMICFVVFAFILLVYYVGRIVTLYIGAVLAPIGLLLWLLPGFKDFTETAIKTYLMTVFVLFVHVVILILAASLFEGLIAGSPTQTPDTLMAMVVGVATLIALLKTQGVMMQFSYASIGPRNAKMLGRQFINGFSAFAAGSKASHSTVKGTTGTYVGSSGYTSAVRPNRRNNQVNTSDPAGTATNPGNNRSPRTNGATTSTRPKATNTQPKPKTGTTTVAPRQIAASEAKVAKPIKTKETKK